MRSGSRTVARKLALQALYRWQLNDGPWQDLISEFATAEDMPRADAAYFQALVCGVVESRVALDGALAPLLDRLPALLDPVEHAVLLIGAHELLQCPDVPFRVVLDEAITLARRFGATDGHRYINGVLDKLARQARPHEH
jgi:N utilization substance protein B